jgi:hypothetical protein
MKRIVGLSLVGFALPWVGAALFFSGTSYELVLGWMLGGAVVGGAVGALLQKKPA